MFESISILVVDSFFSKELAIKLLGLILLLSLFTFRTHANAQYLESFYIQFKAGEYQKALSMLSGIRASHEFLKTKYYLSALCLKNLEDHDKAILFFKKAIKEGYKSEDLFFEYGQSLFALNKLDSAKRAFQISFKKKYKPVYSLYYIAHINEILEEHTSVKTNYLSILKDKNATKSMKQVAYFRLAELIYTLVENKFYVHQYIEKYIGPLIEKSISLDPDAKVAKEASSRYDEMLIKHNLHPHFLINGRMLPKKDFTFLFTQQFKNDDNVTLQSDAPAVTNTALNTASSISDTELYTSKRYSLRRRVTLTPELRFNYVEYGERENSEVFQNDSYSFAPAIRGTYEFNWNQKVASLLFELEYNYTARDKHAEGRRSFFGRSYTYSFGLRRQFFKKGTTTLKVRVRDLDSYFDGISGTTTTLYADQLWMRENGHFLIGLFIMDLYRPEDSFNATNSYLFRTDYVIPKLLLGIDFVGSASINMLDTKAQSDVRGTERLIDLGLRVQRRVGNHFRVAAFYNYQSNASSDEVNFSYTKSISGLELRFNW